MRMCAWRSMLGAVLGGVALMGAGVAGGKAAGGQAGVEISVGEAELSPSEVTAGESVSAHSVGEGCTSGPGETAALVWAVFPRGEFVWGEHLGWRSADAVVSGIGYFLPSGKWSALVTIPDLDANPPGRGEIGPGSPVTSPVLRVFGPLPFTVDGEHELDFVAKCYTHPSEPGDLAVSPEVPEIGGSATVSGLDPCPLPHTQGGSVAVLVWKIPFRTGTSLPPTLGELIRLPPVEPAADGSWSTTFQIPDEPDHYYGFAAGCRNAEGGVTFRYLYLGISVREPDGPPVEVPPDGPPVEVPPVEPPAGVWDDFLLPPGASAPSLPTAPPARPVRAVPTYTG